MSANDQRASKLDKSWLRSDGASVSFFSISPHLLSTVTAHRWVVGKDSAVLRSKLLVAVSSVGDVSWTAGKR